jgi:hypothetical protein
MTILFIIALVMMFTMGNFNEIAKNFPKYRCNPMMMPFAGSFGYDAKENFDFCLTNLFNGKAAQIFAPIYTLLGSFTDTVKTITNVALGLRQLFANFLLGVNNFIRSVRDKIQALLTNVRMSFLKINNLMGKVYGTMISVIFMGTSAMTAGMSVSDNSLVQFLFEFCFAPETLIRLRNGTYTQIQHLQIGDVLASYPGNKDPRVTSVLRFDGSKTPMVRIGDVVVSGEHYVRYAKKWMAAKDHPEAVAVDSIPTLVCLNVTGHQFIAGSSLVVADYDEHETAAVVEATQALALKALNGRTDSAPPTDYSLGVDPALNLELEDGSWKTVRDVQCGDSLKGAGRVLGIVQEECEDPVSYKGISMAPGQLVFDGARWIRAATATKTCTSNKSIMMSLITERCGTMHGSTGTDDVYLRDYREVALPEMEQAYAEAFGTEKI